MNKIIIKVLEFCDCAFWSMLPMCIMFTTMYILFWHNKYVAQIKGIGIPLMRSFIISNRKSSALWFHDIAADNFRAADSTIEALL